MYARELLDSIGITSTAPRFVIITALVYIVPIAVCMGYTALKGRILNKG
jgi:hypothetical protein